MTVDKARAELEAAGIDVDTAMSRMQRTIDLCKAIAERDEEIGRLQRALVLVNEQFAATSDELLKFKADMPPAFVITSAANFLEQNNAGATDAREYNMIAWLRRVAEGE